MRVVLYEMLTGERPFQGEDQTETLASVVQLLADQNKQLPLIGCKNFCLD